MKFKASTFFCVTAFLISGCSVHPLPQNISRKTTIEIVNKIRCEALAGIILQISYLLWLGGPESKRLSQELQARVANGRLVTSSDDLERVLAALEADRAHPQLAKNILTYEKWSIGYDFEFEITELNKLGGEAGFKNPLSPGLFSLGLKTGLDRTRKAKRDFLVVDSFQEYNALGQSGLCANHDTKPNWIYPITGRIGVAEVMDTYFTLHSGQGKLNEFADQVIFTTTIVGDVNPSIDLMPVGDAFKLATASLSSVNSRTGVHSVTITLEPPKKGKVNKAGAFATLKRRQDLNALSRR